MNLLMASIEKNKGKPDEEHYKAWGAVVKWLRVDPNDGALAAVPWIQRALNLMARNYFVRTTWNAHPPLRRNSSLTDYANALVNNRDRGVEFGDPFFAPFSRENRLDVVNHEFFHLVGAHHGNQDACDGGFQALITTPNLALDSACNLTHLVNPSNT